jgi:hypothetical protein
MVPVTSSFWKLPTATLANAIPDDGNDRAGHHRRHEESDDVDAGKVDDDPDQKVDDAGDEDPGKRQSLVLAGPALDREHGTDERERRAQVAGYLAAGDDKEDQSPDAAEENHRVRVEPEDQRDQHRGAEHRHHVLNPEQDGLRPWQALLRIDDVALPRSRCHRHGPYPLLIPTKSTISGGPLKGAPTPFRSG